MCCVCVVLLFHFLSIFQSIGFFLTETHLPRCGPFLTERNQFLRFQEFLLLARSISFSISHPLLTIYINEYRCAWHGREGGWDPVCGCVVSKRGPVEVGPIGMHRRGWWVCGVVWTECKNSASTWITVVGGCRTFTTRWPTPDLLPKFLIQ